MELIKKALLAYITVGFVFIIMGICFLAWPHASLVTICYAIGAVILIWGIVKIVNFVKNREKGLSYQFNLVLGIFLAAVGLILIINPDIIIPILPIVVGIILTADGIQKIKAGFDAKRMLHEKWWLIEIVALITIVFGICLILNPFAITNVVVRLIGFALLIDGVQNLIVIISTFKLMSTMVSDDDVKNAEYVESDIPYADNSDVKTEKIDDSEIIVEDNNDKD